MKRFQDVASDSTGTLKCDLARDVLLSSGLLRLQVMGWSMLPTLWPGDTLLIQPESWNRISAGDIVLFMRCNRLFAHRVLSASDCRDESSPLITQGDALPLPDPAVEASEVLGKVSSIFRPGKALQPGTKLTFGKLQVAAFLRRSSLSARILVRLHGLRSIPLRETQQEQVIPCQS